MPNDTTPPAWAMKAVDRIIDGSAMREEARCLYGADWVRQIAAIIAKHAPKFESRQLHRRVMRFAPDGGSVHGSEVYDVLIQVPDGISEQRGHYIEYGDLVLMPKPTSSGA